MTDDDPMGRPDGQRHEEPEPEQDETSSKAINYAVLGILVLLLMVLVATGVVPIFDM